MTEGELSVIPLEARPYQGTAAGVATRLAANTIDGFIVFATMMTGYAGYAAVRLVLSPRTFRLPDMSLDWAVLFLVAGVVAYLTAMWSINGRTFGDQVMALRLVGTGGAPLRLPRAFARATLCVGFPVGLLWCVVDPGRRSLQDLLLRTSVIYDWLPRPTKPGQSEHRGEGPSGSGA